MKTIIFFALSLVFTTAFADARFVEAPVECHFPYDNADVENEYKVSSCVGVLKSRSGGGIVDAFVSFHQTDVHGGGFVIDGVDVRIPDDVPGGVHSIRTSGEDSGTPCNVIDANGNQYITGNWSSVTTVNRTKSIYRIDVQYSLGCWGAQIVQ